MSTVAAPPAPATTTGPACGNCREPMRVMRLAGHYASEVELDICEHCDLVWFDGHETARLTGPALVDLIAEMAHAHACAHVPLGRDVRCLRCRGGVVVAFNQSRFGRSSQLQCRARHGAYQSFAQFLQEKGLVREMSKVDRARLLQGGGRLHCVNCGGDVQAHDEECTWCRSVPSLFDVARLARALDPRDTVEPQPMHARAARQGAWSCAACGSALPRGETVACDACGATLAVTDVAEAIAAARALQPALQAAADKPSPAVVERRLAAIDADLPRRREFVAGLQAEADARSGRTRFGRDDDGDGAFGWALEWLTRTNPLRAVAIALVIWFAWRVWG